MKAGLVAADDAGLEAAVACLVAGRVVVVPTDTVYGLAVDLAVPGAADLLFELKGRPRDVPIAVLVGGADQAWALADEGGLSAGARALADKYWPGALTVVVRRVAGWGVDLGDEGDTVGLRCPDHEWVRDLCRRVGPLATTSANLHGQSTPTNAASVAALFGDRVALVVDGGVSDGAPSTVVDCSTGTPRVLRAGRIPVADLGLADPAGG